MNWDLIEEKWKQAAGLAKTKWGKLTDNDLKAIAGKRDQLIGKLRFIPLHEFVRMLQLL